MTLIERLKCVFQRFFFWIDYVPIISQIKALIQLCIGDVEEAKATEENFIGLAVSLLDPYIFYMPCDEYYCAKPKPCVTWADWMKNLDNSIPVTHVNMPGTHDSGCRTGGTFARCQVWSIGDQLKAGIRSFDIRCRAYRDKFQVVHGIINCHLMFDTVLKYCEDFLKDNPTEFIVMRIRKEAEAVYHSRPFDLIYREYASQPVFLKACQKEVTVGQARGKIIVIKTFPGEGTGNEWPEDGIIVQDNFMPKSPALKLEDISTFYDKSLPDPAKFHVNVLAACNPRKNLWPRYYARRANKMMLDILQDPSKRHFGGLFVMDFPGRGLINEIINLNYLKEKVT